MTDITETCGNIAGFVDTYLFAVRGKSMRCKQLNSRLDALLSTALLILILGANESHGARGQRGYAPLRPSVKPSSVEISPLAPPGHVVFKFREGMNVHEGKSRLGGASAARAVDVFLRRGLAEPSPSVTMAPEVLREKTAIAEDRVKTTLPDLSLYFRHPVSDPKLAEDVINDLLALEEIETAYFAPRPEVAALKPGPGSGYAEWLQTATTPTFEPGQLYLNAAPGGVGARIAWTLPGGTGVGTRVIDVEYGWQLTHEDLPGGATAIVIGVNPTGDRDHGTAVLGEMAAGRNGFGMTGIAYDAAIGISSVWTMSTADAITMAVDAADPGDAILIELHAPGPHYNFEGRDDQSGYIAMEYWQDNFDAMLYAWANGVIVCEAAGNGSENFDDPMYDSLFHPAYRYSHAIICGAGNPPNAIATDRSKLDFSNWGQRVDLQGYGILVYTTGYGDLYSTGGEDFLYTAGFSGTSSASPIVTGAVLSVSGVFQQMLGIVPDADTIRNLLINTGSPQQTPQLTRHIGPRPNLGSALGYLFDPIDSIWYGDVTIGSGQSVSIPVSMNNSHALRDIYLPFKMTGPAPIIIDSLTRDTRTSSFEQVQLVYDNRGNGQAGYLMRADNGGGSPHLPGGSGVIANLWVHAGAVTTGQVNVIDSAWLGSSTRLRLVSYFDDGYPDYFSPGSVTADALCDCSSHGDVSDDGVFDITDVVIVVGIAFRGGSPAISDPACPHATRADYTCNGVIDVVDVVRTIDYIFRGGLPICDPCAP